MDDFTPLSGFVGGLMIGAAAALLLWLDGRTAGISGIAGGLLEGKGGAGWRALFLAGLLLGPLGYALVGGGIVVNLQAPWPVLAVAGLLVGFGTRLGSGCTSGHGVCGVARLSRRSIVATVVFMVVAVLTVYVTRHVVGGAA